LYDINDERIAEVANSATTTYPFTFYNVATSSTGKAIFTKHIFANGEPVADVQGSTTTAKVYYIHDDALGGECPLQCFWDSRRGDRLLPVRRHPGKPASHAKISSSPTMKIVTSIVLGILVGLGAQFLGLLVPRILPILNTGEFFSPTGLIVALLIASYFCWQN